MIHYTFDSFAEEELRCSQRAQHSRRSRAASRRGPRRRRCRQLRLAEDIYRPRSRRIADGIKFAAAALGRCSCPARTDRRHSSANDGDLPGGRAGGAQADGGPHGGLPAGAPLRRKSYCKIDPSFGGRACSSRSPRSLFETQPRLASVGGAAPLLRGFRRTSFRFSAVML
jgi:hypothetical protein